MIILHTMILEITNDTKYLRFVFDEVSKFCVHNSIDETTKYKLNLIIEEYLTNIIEHGTIDGKVHQIEIEINKVSDGVHVKIIDDSLEYNLLKTEMPDLNKKIEDKEPGGLGVYLILQTADEKKYLRENNKNHFEFMIKFQ